MAYDPKPSTWLGAGFASSSSGHTITLNTNDASTNKLLSLLTDANADPTTGDIEALCLAISDALYQAWLGQGADVPTKMTISRTAMSNRAGTIIYTYHFQFQIVPPTAFTVAAE